VARHGVSIALACRAFGVSETSYHYSPLLSDENEKIADLLVGLTTARQGIENAREATHGRLGGLGYASCICAHQWNHKRVDPTRRQVNGTITVRRIYCELELNLLIKPHKRLKRDKSDALAVPNGVVAQLRPRSIHIVNS